MAAMMDQRDDEQYSWKKGQFQILFISMGQGDCCVVTCPNGDHIMIDCGSKSYETVGMSHVSALLRGRWVLNRPNTERMQLRALILTHPDLDHVNKIHDLIGGGAGLGAANAIPVEEVYFSDTLPRRADTLESAPLRNYDCGDSLRNFCKVKNLYCVTLREGERSLHRWTPPFGAKQHSIEDEDLLADGRLTINYGEIDADDEEEGIDWEVSIIAGNVLRERGDHSDGDGRNAASLVTLVRRGDEKVLICGDATLSTQNYLYNTFKNTDHIKSLTMLQAPHHGSTATASTPDFIKLVSPQRVVISVKSDEHTHHHPGVEVIEAFMPYALKTGAKHRYRAWQQVGDTAFHELASRWEDEKGKTIDYASSSETGVRRYTRKEPPDDFTGEIVLDGVGAPASAVKYVLYQRQTDREIRQTGLDEHQFLYLP